MSNEIMSVLAEIKGEIGEIKGEVKGISGQVNSLSGQVTDIDKRLSRIEGKAAITAVVAGGVAGFGSALFKGVLNGPST